MMRGMTFIGPKHSFHLYVLALSLTFCTVPVMAQEPSAPAAPPPTWTGTAGAGLSFTSGNSDTTTFSVAFDITRDPKVRNVVKMTGLYLRGSQNSEATVNRTSLGFRDEYSMNARLFLFGQVDYLRDTFKLIDYLLAPTAGLGYAVVSTDAMKFSVDVGAGGVWEKNPGGDVSASGAVTVGESLEIQVTEAATIKHAVTALLKTTDFGDGLYTFSVGLGTKVSERVQLSVDVLSTYKSRPPTADTKKNDVAFVTSLAAKF